jgi:hypothetical protein
MYDLQPIDAEAELQGSDPILSLIENAGRFEVRFSLSEGKTEDHLLIFDGIIGTLRGYWCLQCDPETAWYDDEFVGAFCRLLGQAGATFVCHAVAARSAPTTVSHPTWDAAKPCILFMHHTPDLLRSAVLQSRDDHGQPEWALSEWVAANLEEVCWKEGMLGFHRQLQASLKETNHLLAADTMETITDISARFFWSPWFTPTPENSFSCENTVYKQVFKEVAKRNAPVRKLISAARSGRVKDIGELLVNSSPMAAGSALVAAAGAGRVKATTLVLDHGVNLAQFGEAALTGAIRAGSDSIVALLIERGVQLSAEAFSEIQNAPMEKTFELWNRLAPLARNAMDLDNLHKVADGLLGRQVMYMDSGFTTLLIRAGADINREAPRIYSFVFETIVEKRMLVAQNILGFAFSHGADINYGGSLLVMLACDLPTKTRSMLTFLVKHGADIEPALARAREQSADFVPILSEFAEIARAKREMQKARETERSHKLVESEKKRNDRAAERNAVVEARTTARVAAVKELQDTVSRLDVDDKFRQILNDSLMKLTVAASK